MSEKMYSVHGLAGLNVFPSVFYWYCSIVFFSSNVVSVKSRVLPITHSFFVTCFNTWVFCLFVLLLFCLSVYLESSIFVFNVLKFHSDYALCGYIFIHCLVFLVGSFHSRNVCLSVRGSFLELFC